MSDFDLSHFLSTLPVLPGVYRMPAADGAVLYICKYLNLNHIIYQNWSLAEAKREMVNGPYGFHPIWRNMENFFTEQNIAEVQTRLKDLGSQILLEHQ